MKNFRKLIAMLLSFSVLTTASKICSAAVESSTYNKTYIENFEDAETVFGDNGIFESVQNVTADSVKVVASNQGGKYLEMASINNLDVQIRTKKGVFKHDVTVIDMVVSSVIGSQPFPLVRLVNNNAKMDTGNGVFRFVDSNKIIRSYNQTTGNHDVVTISNEWVNVRIVLDSVNKKITTSFNGSQVTTVSEMSSSWDNENVQLLFQAAAASTIRIDDIVVSDGTYSENIYMVQDFEHSNTVNAAIGNEFFYNISKTQNPVVTYDSVKKNTYLDITNANSNLIYTAWTIDTLTTTAVVEFDMKATSASGSSISLKRDTNKAVTPLFAANEVNADGNFHKYRAVVSVCQAGYKVEKFVDGVSIGYNQRGDGAFGGADARLEIQAGAASTGVGIDNLKIYYPQSAQLSCELDGRNDVGADSVIELFSNTPINSASAAAATITANGETVSFQPSWDLAKNSYILNIDGGIKYNTTYVITTGETGVKDAYGQYYNKTITFETPIPATGQISCKINGENVEDTTLINGAMEFIFKVKSNVASQISTTACIKQYNAEGSLIRENRFPVLVDGVGDFLQRAGLDVTDDIKSIKMFLWSDGDEPINITTELVK